MICGGFFCVCFLSPSKFGRRNDASFHDGRVEMAAVFWGGIKL